MVTNYMLIAWTETDDPDVKEVRSAAFLFLEAENARGWSSLDCLV